MVEADALRPLFESTWLAAASIPLLLILLAAGLIFLVRSSSPARHWIWGNFLRPMLRNTKLLAWLGVAAVSIIAGFASLDSVTLGIHSTSPSAQSLLQQRLAQDEKALDRGVLTYRQPPILATEQPVTLTVTVTDLGKHPSGTISAASYSAQTDLSVYPNNIPTGGIVSLSMKCGDAVYCQALSSTRRAIVGTGDSQSWSWNLTPLQSGQEVVTITADTYDGASDTVLSEELIDVRLQVEPGPWYSALDGWWDTVTNFVTTTAGIITAVGGAVVVVAGGVAWFERRRAGKAKRQPKKGAPKHRRQRGAGEQGKSQEAAEQVSRPEV